jgi:hypothetical protein
VAQPRLARADPARVNAAVCPARLGRLRTLVAMLLPAVLCSLLLRALLRLLLGLLLLLLGAR